MLIRLIQGFGRLIRTERDSGCVAILDYRVRTVGAYRDPVLCALPSCRVTDRIAAVRRFFETAKDEPYFS